MKRREDQVKKMSNYSQDGFEDNGNSNNVSANQAYKLKLSIDIREAKNFKMAANAFV